MQVITPRPPPHDRHSSLERSETHLRLLLGNGVSDDLMEAGVGSGSLLAALQQQAIAGPNRQGSNLGQGIWPRLKDDQQHPNGGCYLLQLQALCNLHSAENLAYWLILGCYGA